MLQVVYVCCRDGQPFPVQQDLLSRYQCIQLAADDILHGEHSVPLSTDVVLVDWDTARVGVFPVLREQLRLYTAPIIALCGANPAERVAALVVGADYAEVGPLRADLLEACICAYSQRSTPALQLASTSTTDSGDGSSVAVALGGMTAVEEQACDLDQVDATSLDPIVFDHDAHLCLMRGERVALTKTEYLILAYLREHESVCCSRDDILRHVWGFEFNPGTNLIDFHICRLRCKLKKHGLEGVLITVRGQGFRFDLATS